MRAATIGGGAALVAAGCCAALPLVAATAGGLSVAALTGVVGGIVVAVPVLAMVIGRVRRRSACEHGGSGGR